MGPPTAVAIPRASILDYVDLGLAGRLRTSAVTDGCIHLGRTVIHRPQCQCYEGVIARLHHRGTTHDSMPKPRFKIKSKYPKPKILLVDLDADCTESLRSAGYNVRSGSFGAPYPVKPSDGAVRVVDNSDLPNFEEQEIVIADLQDPPTLNEAPPGPRTHESEASWWAQASMGSINPRPIAIGRVANPGLRIYRHGGLFIFFAAPRSSLRFGAGQIQHRRLVASWSEYDNWGILPVLHKSMIEVSPMTGEEILVSGKNTLSQLLSVHAPHASYTCVFDRTFRLEREHWYPIARNKFHQTVSALITPPEAVGWIILLPRIVDKAEFIRDLIAEVLPSLAPKLFPHSTLMSWKKEAQYELPMVRRLHARIEAIRCEANDAIASIDEEVQQERDRFAFLYDILSETGTALVHAVKQSIEALGFHDVVEMDRELQEGDEKGQKREDLQLRDRSPLLLVEVKGIDGLPREAAALQSWKYIAPRMKQLDRTDVRALSIINHQRNLPPLDRQNAMPFQGDVIENAEQHGFGLLTTWDLHRLARSYILNDWKPADVQELLYQVGRVVPVPTHYHALGVVEKHWPTPNAVSIRLEGDRLRLHDRIALELPVHFEELQVDSMQLDDIAVETAQKGDVIGVKLASDLGRIREGVQVFRVSRAQPEET